MIVYLLKEGYKVLAGSPSLCLEVTRDPSQVAGDLLTILSIRDLQPLDKEGKKFRTIFSGFQYGCPNVKYIGSRIKTESMLVNEAQGILDACAPDLNMGGRLVDTARMAKWKVYLLFEAAARLGFKPGLCAGTSKLRFIKKEK